MGHERRFAPNRNRFRLRDVCGIVALGCAGGAGCLAEPLGGTCETSSTPLSSAEATAAAGFSLNDVVLRAQLVHAQLDWQPVGSQHAGYVPSEGSTRVEVAVSTANASIEEVRVLSHDTASAHGYDACRPHMNAAIQLRVVTDDGALNETLPAKVVAFSREEATISGDLAPAAARGSFRVTSSEDPAALTYFFLIRIKGETMEGFFGGRSLAAVDVVNAQGTATPTEARGSGQGFVAATWIVPSKSIR